MAGFELPTYGRFWVPTEAPEERWLFEQLRSFLIAAFFNPY